jgi:hemoglobin
VGNDRVVQSVFEAAGGDDGLLRLAEAWHARVMADEVVSHAFSRGFHPQHSERLAGYWAEALGGPHTYSEHYGDETGVVRIHIGNGPHEEMDQRAITCFDQALNDSGLIGEPLRQVLHDYFAWATTTSMSAFPDTAADVPQGLTVPRWSWDGLQKAPAQDSGRLDQEERPLNDRGRRVGRVRVAAGRSGIAVAFPDDPMHVSWAALTAIVGIVAAIKVRRA